MTDSTNVSEQSKTKSKLKGNGREQLRLCPLHSFCLPSSLLHASHCLSLPHKKGQRTGLLRQGLNVRAATAGRALRKGKGAPLEEQILSDKVKQEPQVDTPPFPSHTHIPVHSCAGASILANSLIVKLFLHSPSESH